MWTEWVEKPRSICIENEMENESGTGTRSERGRTEGRRTKAILTFFASNEISVVSSNVDPNSMFWGRSSKLVRLGAER